MTLGHNIMDDSNDSNIKYPDWNNIIRKGGGRQHRPHRNSSYAEPTYMTAVAEVIRSQPYELRERVGTLPGKEPLLTSLLETFVESMSDVRTRKRAEKIKDALTTQYGDEEQATKDASSIVDACSTWMQKNPEKAFALHDQTERQQAML